MESDRARSQLRGVEQKINDLTLSARASRRVRTKVEELRKEIEELEKSMVKHGQAG